MSHLKNAEKGSPAQQIGALYRCAMDSAAIDKAGLSPLQADLDRIQVIKNAADVVREMAREYTNGDWMWDWYVESLSNKTYYFKTDSASQAITGAYKKYIARILILGGDGSRADTDAASVFSLERKLAKASKSPAELRDPQANYHLMSVREMNRLAPKKVE